MFKVGTLPIMNRAEFVREGMMAKSPKRSSSKELAMVPYSPKEMTMVANKKGSPKELAMVPYSPQVMTMVANKKGSPKENSSLGTTPERKRKCTTNRNGTPPCAEGYTYKKNNKGEDFCYKTRQKKTKQSVSPVKEDGKDFDEIFEGIYTTKPNKMKEPKTKTKEPVSPVKEVTPKKASPVAKKTVKCTTNKNGTPPCADGYTSNKNKKGEDCCYKTKK